MSQSPFNNINVQYIWREFVNYTALYKDTSSYPWIRLLISQTCSSYLFCELCLHVLLFLRLLRFRAVFGRQGSLSYDNGQRLLDFTVSPSILSLIMFVPIIALVYACSKRRTEFCPIHRFLEDRPTVSARFLVVLLLLVCGMMLRHV